MDCSGGRRMGGMGRLPTLKGKDLVQEVIGTENLKNYISEDVERYLED
jgi:hypothetical protein